MTSATIATNVIIKAKPVTTAVSMELLLLVVILAILLIFLLGICLYKFGCLKRNRPNEFDGMPEQYAERAEGRPMLQHQGAGVGLDRKTQDTDRQPLQF